MKPYLALSTALLAAVVSMPTLDAALTLHSSMDNADVGAGGGMDSTADGPFRIGDSVAGNDGTAADNASGMATATNHVTSGALGQIGQAISFDRAGTGSNRAVSYGDIFDIGTGDFTASLWFNVANPTVQQFVAGKGNQGSGDVGWSFFIENNTLITRLGGGGAGNRASQSVNISGFANQWHHVAFVVDNTAGTVTGYLDGSNAGFVSSGGGPTSNMFAPGTDVSNGDSLLLGIRRDSQLEYSGELDDFALWDEALDAASIDQIYQNGLNGIAVPEPSIATFLLGGLIAVVFRRRRG